MPEPFTFVDGGGWIDWGSFFKILFDACIFFLPLLVCLLVVGFFLWIFDIIYGNSWGSRPP